jgi:hypothetical protein
MSNPNTPKVNDAEPRLSPWQVETRRRWLRLRGLIAETEYDLTRIDSHDERLALEASLRLLKRSALSVWVDARRAEVELTGAPSDNPNALVEW